MNIALWIIQIILAIKCVSSAYTHAFGAEKPYMLPGRKRFGRALRLLLTMIGLVVLLIAIGLFLPAVVGYRTWLVPFSAILLALMLLASIVFHLSCRDKPKIWVSLVLFAMAALVAYGRWVILPL